jgi:selenide, water dikinase
MEPLKLTQFSPGAGCGCKIAPRELEEIIRKENYSTEDVHLLVGHDTKDDAAVYEISEEQAVISTTDFFTPIVDDPFHFGQIAAVNAISDIYAMGGRPLMAISILGWPLEKLPAEMAHAVIEGARKACSEAKIPLAGGHSISISDPIFGLAVTGIIEKKNIKQNNTATKDCLLFLTKPLGVGIITTAEKKGIVKMSHQELALKQMTRLNNAGTLFGKLPQVKAMTDVTGFGFLGHLLEMCEGSNLSATIDYAQIPVIKGLDEYIEQKAVPGGTYRNWKSYGDKIGPLDEKIKLILCDPQTSGGLLVAVEPEGEQEFLEITNGLGLSLSSIGYLKLKNESWIKFK